MGTFWTLVFVGATSSVAIPTNLNFETYKQCDEYRDTKIAEVTQIYSEQSQFWFDEWMNLKTDPTFSGNVASEALTSHQQAQRQQRQAYRAEKAKYECIIMKKGIFNW